MITIQLNGKSKDIQPDRTVTQLLEMLELHPQRVAVEINREILKRDLYAEHCIKNGDEIEVLQFVGGGSESLSICCA